MDSSDSGGDFLQRILGDLLQVMGTSTPGNAAPVELARTLAQGIATGGEPERNVEPVERMAYEELARIADMHVTEITGLPTAPAGATVEVVPTTPGVWAWQTLEDWRFLFDAATTRSTTASSNTPGATARREPDLLNADHPLDQPGVNLPPDDVNPPRDDDTRSSDLNELGANNLDALSKLGNLDALGPMGSSGESADLMGDPSDMFAKLMATMSPMLAATQLGSAIGHLARNTLGQYDLPVPRTASPRIMLIPANVTRFAEEWSLPLDQVRLWLCLRELATHSVLSLPHVNVRMRELLSTVVSGLVEDTAQIADRLGELDPADPEILQRLMGNPGSLLGSEPPPARMRAGEELTAIVSVLLGYVEHVLDVAGTRLLGGRSALTEAWRRRQVNSEGSDRAAELLLGLDLSPTQVDRGIAFVRGIIDRAGKDGLALLWGSSNSLPTPNEVDAPGLWLERVRMDAQDQ